MGYSSTLAKKRYEKGLLAMLITNIISLQRVSKEAVLRLVAKVILLEAK